LETLREFDTQAAALLPTTRKKLESVTSELEQLEQQERTLTLRAPSAGQVLPPPIRRSQTAAGMLPTWSGTPLDKRNAGATLAAGTLFCLVGDPQHCEARLAIEQEAVAAVAVGQQVELKLQQQPARTLVGRIAAISPLDLAETVPDELRAWDLPFQFDASGTPVLDGTYYQALVTLEDTGEIAATLRSRGKARIHVAPETLAETIRRWFHRTFRSS
jgi:putative peptide zinc metalloprotease protein